MKLAVWPQASYSGIFQNGFIYKLEKMILKCLGETVRIKRANASKPASTVSGTW